MSESGGSRIYTGRRPEENSNAIHQWQLSSKYYQIISYTNVPATHMIIPKIIVHTSPCAAVDWPRGHEFTTVLKREDNWRQSSPFHVLFIFLSRLRVLIYHKTTPNFRLDSSKKKPHLTERHWTRFNQADFFPLSRSVLITYFPIWLSTPPPPPWLISLLMVHATQYLHLPAGLHICAFWLPYQLISMFVNELNWIGIDCINKFVH